MNRSVINWMITAGVLTAGAGIGTAPAVADPVGSGTVNGAGTDDRGAVTGQRPVRTKGRGGTGRPGGCVDQPCQWPWMCNARAVTRVRRNNNVFVMPPVLPSTLTPPAAPVVEPAAAPDLDVADLDIADTASLEGAAADAAIPAQAALPVRALPAVPAPIALARPAPIAAPGVPVPTPAAPLFEPPAAPPPAVAESVQAPRLGYPEELRNADFRKLVSVALPGLAALAGMTALGGLFGYRQAKAGYVLRTVAAGRFLQ